MTYSETESQQATKGFAKNWLTKRTSTFFRRSASVTSTTL